MKTLFILRHAKSSWKEPGQDDYDRPLNNRGKRTAPAMGKLMAGNNLMPGLIVSSSACRAKETVELLVSGAQFEGQVIFDDDLYLAPAAAYVETAAELDDAYNSVMFVGHNPGLEQLVSNFDGNARAMPTAALAHFELPVDRWNDFNTSTDAQLIELYIPRDLGFE